ncbi:zinc finger CCHC domain-containing protein 8-like [Lytechinus pictus]|uniref:zinc finger CCHC domain-containing protein 8-like n=1 Tax=Lytechinus pictus TaxID=7653 RepID=UPI0030BA21C5
MAAPTGSSEDDVFGDLNLFEEFSSTARTTERKEPTKKHPWETEKADLEEELTRLKQENQKLQAQLKICIQSKGYKVSEGTQDGPIAQVIYMNHDKVCKYRQDIEKYFEHVCSEYFAQQAQPMGKKYEYSRPLPQCSSMVLGENPDPDNQQAFTVTGNVQYYLLFCLDTLGRPLVDGNVEMTEGWEIPLYPIIFREALPVDDKPSAPSKGRRPKASCFNCGNEKHSLRECPVPRDLVRISQNKKLFMDQMSSSPANTISGRRYHKEGETKETEDRFKTFKPGVLSDALRQALGLSSNQLPPYIYGMRRLGYPPGHYMDAQVHKSDLKVYNIKDTDEEGEVPSDGEGGESAQPKFNLNKLIDYPGFNVDAHPSIADEWQRYNSIPMQNNQRKEVLKLHLTPMAVDEDDMVTPRNKRRNRDFHESSSQKKRRIEQDAVDMDISTEYPDTPVRGWFQPPLPPTPEIATPPPLPPGSAPPTPIRDSPSASSQDDSLPWQSANTSLSASRQNSQASSRSTSPDLDRLMTERNKLLAALEKGGDSVSSSSDVIASGVDTTEEEEDGEVENDKRTKVANKKVHSKDKKENGHDGHIERTDEAGESNPDVSSKDSPDSPEPQSLNSSSQWIILDTTGDNSVFMSQEVEEDETPNKSGVPHRRNFSVNITPHDFEVDEPKKKGIFQKILGILKRDKN